MPVFNALKRAFFALFFTICFAAAPSPSFSIVKVDSESVEFQRNVEKELERIRSGQRGWIMRDLLSRMETSTAETWIKPLTRNEATWHPNDRKGTRSHVLPDDVLVRGAARTEPTNAILYLHPSRIQPGLSVFKIGTFAHELAEAHDVNLGLFSGDYQTREKRSSFFQNAWRDSLGLSALEQTGRVTTTEYPRMKELGFIREEYARFMPILDPRELDPGFHEEIIQMVDLPEVVLSRGGLASGQIFWGDFQSSQAFLKVLYAEPDSVVVRFGRKKDGQFKIYEGRVSLIGGPVVLPVKPAGVDFSPLMNGSRLLSEGETDRESEKYSKAWFEELAEIRS